MVQEAGVVGAGGAGFPTHLKLAAKVELLMVNGAECEPLLQVDQELIKVYAAELVEALCVCMSVTGAVKGVFAIKGMYETARAALEEAIAGRPELAVFVMGNFYPAGDEQVLVHEVTGRVVPEGGIPLQVGAVVINVETLWNIYQALQGAPVTDSYVTVAGSVARPVTLRVAIGTPVRDVIEAAGGAVSPEVAVIHGGPMMGSLVTSLEMPVSKTTKGLIVLPREHPLIRRRYANPDLSLSRAITACCQCRQCTDLCPRYLLGHTVEPHRIMRVAGYGLANDTVAWTSAFLCSECGVCDSFACPADLSPRDVFRAVKAQLIAAGVKNPHHAVPLPRVQWRVPTDRLVWRMGLMPYFCDAPLISDTLQPQWVKVPLKQNQGARSVAMVKKGDRVARGQLIATPPEGMLGARHHASVSGVVVGVGDEVVIRRV